MKNYRFASILFIMFTALVVLACGGINVSFGDNATPVPIVHTVVYTVIPTNPPATEKPAPTSRPQPTKTAEPTEIPVNFEVDIIAVEARNRVYPGGGFTFSPANGYMLLDVGVKVINLTNSNISVRWDDVYVMNENKEWAAPDWGTWKDVGNNLDPFSFGISETEVNPEDEISVKSTGGYVRVIYHIPRGDTYYFGFGNSDTVKLNIK